jgi:type II secretory pathway pseudopilin PulG
MHRKVAVAIVAALALVAASCGGTETTTLGRAALVKRVETVCREAQDAAARESRATRTPDPIAALQAGQRLLKDKLEGLEGSGSVKADYDAYKEGVKTRYELIERVAAASRADRARVIRSVEADATAASRRMETAARRLGLEGCS